MGKNESICKQCGEAHDDCFLNGLTNCINDCDSLVCFACVGPDDPLRKEPYKKKKRPKCEICTREEREREIYKQKVQVFKEKKQKLLDLLATTVEDEEKKSELRNAIDQVLNLIGSLK